MVTKIYLIRHAETIGNVEEFFQGRIDCELSEKGKKQLEYLSERFKTIHFDSIYCSPLKRTMDTAKAVNKYHGKDIIIDERLIEINGGVWEGLKWSDLPRLYPKEHELWQNKMHEFSIENGEKIVDVYERMKIAVDDIVSVNIGKTIVIVSHGGTIKNYLCYANGDAIDKLNDMEWSENTAVSLIEFDENRKPTIIFQNDASHISGDMLTLAFSDWCNTNPK